jgi:hypothetical protein
MRGNALGGSSQYHRSKTKPLTEVEGFYWAENKKSAEQFVAWRERQWQRHGTAKLEQLHFDSWKNKFPPAA